MKMETCLVYLRLSDWMIFVDLVFAKMAFVTSLLTARVLSKEKQICEIYSERQLLSLCCGRKHPIMLIALLFG